MAKSLNEKLEILESEIATLETKRGEINEKIKKLTAQKNEVKRQLKEQTYDEAESVLSENMVDMESLIAAIKSGKLDISALKKTADTFNSHSEN